MDEKEPRLSRQGLKVLMKLMEKPREGLAGADLWRATKVQSGTLYPLLARLEKAGWLESWWETLDPVEAGRPRKRFYRLTGLGQTKANHALGELQASNGWRPAWNG